MRVIVPPPTFIERIIGKQKYVADCSYRLMTYVIQCPVEDGVLLYHTLICSLLLLTQEEFTHLTDHQELIDRWFLVPPQHDDQKLCKQIRQTAHLFAAPGKSIKDYVILTTTSCNARCFYCYEKGATPVTMTKETAESICHFIMDHRGEEIVKFRWFGGEPLVNVKVIDQICSELKQNKIPFESDMVSNGYLFDEDIVRRARDLWHLKKVQISIDGTDQTYNRIKRYIYGNVNAFERVLNNIKLLTEFDINVLIRLNVDKHNIDEMSDLISLFHQKIGANPHLTVYSHALFGQRAPEENKALFEKRMLLEHVIATYGYNVKWKLQKNIKLNFCMADNDQSIMIDPEGNLGKCEHHFNSNFIGHISLEERDERMIRIFKEHPDDIEACSSCPYYPQCIRLKMCANDSECTPERQKENIYNTIEAMKDEYQKYLTNHAHDTEI